MASLAEAVEGVGEGDRADEGTGLLRDRAFACRDVAEEELERYTLLSACSMPSLTKSTLSRAVDIILGGRAPERALSPSGGLDDVVDDCFRSLRDTRTLSRLISNGDFFLISNAMESTDLLME
jgi:hypothetical protein